MEKLSKPPKASVAWLVNTPWSSRVPCYSTPLARNSSGTLEERQLSTSTIRRNLSALSSLFEHLCESNAVLHNPVDGVKRPSEGANEGKTPAIGDGQAHAHAHALLNAPTPTRSRASAIAPSRRITVPRAAL
jgi:site-specific recombinase XerC